MTLWSARCRHRQVEHATVEEDGPTMGNRRNDEVLNLLNLVARCIVRIDHTVEGVKYSNFPHEKGSC